MRLRHDAVLNRTDAVKVESPRNGGLEVKVASCNKGAAVMHGRVHDLAVVHDLDLGAQGQRLMRHAHGAFGHDAAIRAARAHKPVADAVGAGTAARPFDGFVEVAEIALGVDGAS